MLPSRPLSPARSTAILPPLFLSWLALPSASSVARSLDFGFSGPASALSWGDLPRVSSLLLIGSLPHLARSLRLGPEGFKPTCMSDFVQLSQDLRELTAAVRELTLVTRGLAGRRREEDSGSTSTPSCDLGSSRAWELVSDGTAIPGAPADFLRRKVVVEFEEGPPETPDFCLQLAGKNLSSSKTSSIERAREAFKAGFWVRAFWSCNTEYSSQYRPGISASTHWVLRKGSSFEFVRVTSQADCDRLSSEFPDIHYVEKLPTLTELHIFCAGASIPVPPLWRWNAKA